MCWVCYREWVAIKATFGDGITCEIRQQNLSLLFFFLYITLCSRLLQLDFVNITGVTGVYLCYKGYVMIGDKTRRCPNDGTWTGSAPTCRPTCKLCSFTYEIVVTEFCYTTTTNAPYNLRISKLPFRPVQSRLATPLLSAYSWYNVSYTFNHSSSLPSLLQEFSSNRQSSYHLSLTATISMWMNLQTSTWLWLQLCLRTSLHLQI